MPPRPRALAGLLAGLALASGCRSPAPTVPPTSASPAPSGSAPRPPLLALAPPSPGGPWLSTLLADHPLVGKVWDPAAGALVDPKTVIERSLAARFVLLGEKHDNPDHHRLQADIVRALAARGRKLSVAFEMFEEDEQPRIDAYLAAHPGDAPGLGPATSWQKKGWPDWSLYEPIAEAALGAKLPLVAANLPRDQARSIARGGLSQLPSQELARLGLEGPLDPKLRGALEDELRGSHCGQLPESMLGGMADAQRARDGAMASHLLSQAGPDGAVLVAGDGHARLDRGVPLYLQKKSEGARVLSVGFLEVARGEDRPEQYSAGGPAGALPFSLVWFTPRVDEDDPCERFHKP